MGHLHIVTRQHRLEKRWGGGGIPGWKLIPVFGVGRSSTRRRLSPSSLWTAFFYIRNVLLLYSLSVDISPPLSLSLYLYICIININASTCWSPPFFAWAGRFFFGRQSVDDSSGNGVWKSHYGSVRAARGFDSRIIMRHSLFRAKRTDSDIIASYRDHKVSAGRDAAQSPTAFNFIISSPHPRGRLLHPTTDDTEK